MAKSPPNRKSRPFQRTGGFFGSPKLHSAFAAHAGKALAAVHRPILAGLEGNLRLFAAVGADGDVHLPIRLRGGFAGVTAALAALRLVHIFALRRIRTDTFENQRSR